MKKTRHFSKPDSAKRELNTSFVFRMPLHTRARARARTHTHTHRVDKEENQLDATIAFSLLKNPT